MRVRHLSPTRRRGNILPLLALTVTLLFAFVALAIDVGVLTIARTEAQAACDAGALAGARVLNNRPGNVENDKSTAFTVAENTVLQNINVYVLTQKKYTVAENMTFSDGAAISVGQYNYDPLAQRFNPTFPESSGGISWTSVKVRLRGDNPTFFAKVVGVSSMPWETYAVAAHRPRDIAIILDFSGSMSFGSQFTWNGGWAGGTVYGTMNPDDIYPTFGHYSRYNQFSTSAALTSGNAGSGTVGNRPNPFSTTETFDLGVNGTQGSANLTMETASGPPIILDFRMDPSNVNNPSTPVTTPGTLWNAFNRWMTTTPAVENLFLDASFRPGVSSTSTASDGTVTRRFNWSGYNAFDKTNTSGPTPAPDSFKDQSNDDATYVGDRFPRKGGQIFTNSTAWESTVSTGAAKNVQVLLSKATASDTTLIATATRLTAPTVTPLGYTFPAAGDGGTSWASFRDDLWETFGYDLDVSKYSGTTPNGTNRANAGKKVSDMFQGYSMGPGYYGKTFFMWPPDPRFDSNSNLTAPATTGSPAFDTSGRAMADWRRRFFYKTGTSESTVATSSTGRFNPQTDNINTTLFNSAAGATLNPTTTGYKVNYRAVLAWLKSGPQVLPPNLRAGRVLYYSSIPDDCDSFASNLDQRFWRDYIDFVLGYVGNVSGNAPANNLAGAETRAWPEVGGTIALTSTSAQGSNPKPYMSYTDVPSMPRMHFWFGPLTMLGFINDRGGSYKWLAGTTHQAQCWQLKAGMNSALDDIKNNHPNDHCSLQYFADYNFQTPRVPMGQNYTRLKNALFYPYTLLSAIESGDTTAELRPYNLSMSNTLVGNVPYANGGTDPVSGFAQAFNTLSWSASTYNARSSPNNGAQNGGSGRRGAAKVVIFETDGVPNARRQWTYSGTGANTYYAEGGSYPGSDAASDSVAIVNKMNQLQGSGGYNLPNNSVKVHCLAFGDLYTPTPYTSAAQNGLVYLAQLQKAGNTLPSTVTPVYTDFPSGQIIAGTYQNRIAQLKNAMQTIMQSGIQVTLVQ